MEKLKIKISEVEGISIKIPTEFSSHSFKKFFEQMIAVGKAMPNNSLSSAPIETPERLKMTYWQDEDMCLEFLYVWETGGRDEATKWLKERREWTLDKPELSRLSSLAATLRTKYRKAYEERYGKRD